jgi:hypothetical protein
VSEERFPELEEFEAEQHARHRQIVVILALTGVALAGIGAAILLFSDGTPAQVLSAIVLLVGAVLVIGRAGLSWFTDMDTRDRGEFDDE